MINIPNITDTVNSITNNVVNKFMPSAQKLFSEKLVQNFFKVIGVPNPLSVPPVPPTPSTEQPTEPSESGISDEEQKIVDEMPVPEAVGAPVYWDENGKLIGDPNIVQPVTPQPSNPTQSGIPIPNPKSGADIDVSNPPQQSSQVMSGMYASASTYTTSLNMRNHIKSYESLKLTIYQDPDGVHADIGWGHVLGSWADRASFPQSITLAQAEEYFSQDIREAEADVKRYVRQQCTQGQFDSFVDLAYGAGGGWLKKSQTLEAFNRGDICGCGNLYQTAAITGGGKVLPALKTRRMKAYSNFYINNWGAKCA